MKEDLDFPMMGMFAISLFALITDELATFLTFIGLGIALLVIRRFGKCEETKLDDTLQSREGGKVK